MHRVAPANETDRQKGPSLPRTCQSFGGRSRSRSGITYSATALRGGQTQIPDSRFMARVPPHCSGHCSVGDDRRAPRRSPGLHRSGTTSGTPNSKETVCRRRSRLRGICIFGDNWGAAMPRECRKGRYRPVPGSGMYAGKDAAFRWYYHQPMRRLSCAPSHKGSTHHPRFAAVRRPLTAALTVLVLGALGSVGGAYSASAATVSCDTPSLISAITTANGTPGGGTLRSDHRVRLHAGEHQQHDRRGNRTPGHHRETSLSRGPGPPSPDRPPRACRPSASLTWPAVAA